VMGNSSHGIEMFHTNFEMHSVVKTGVKRFGASIDTLSSCELPR
jgi:hypothetical protein